MTTRNTSPEQIAERKAQAQEIMQQLGGFQFITMTGAQYISFSSDAPRANLSFKIRGCRTVTHVSIEANGFDLYDVKFLKIRGSAEPKIVREFAGIQGLYAEDLQRVFTEVTGLATSLGTMGR